MKRLLLILIVLFLSASACRFGADPAVVTATAAAKTAAAASPTPLPPTETPTPLPTATLTPTVTPNATATMIVRATNQAAPVIEELKNVLSDRDADIPYEKGHLAWSKKSAVELSLDEPGGTYDEIASGTKAANFILKSDVTWNTTGIVMCGAGFRSEKDMVNGSHYKFLFLRLFGVPGWEIDFFNYGQYKNTITGKTQFASALNLDNGATNQFVLIARDNKFIIYINGVRQGHFFDDSKQASNGYLTFLAYEDSGKSTCSFENTWLWILDE